MDKVIKCVGDGCEGFMTNFRGNSGVSPGGQPFALTVADVQEFLVPTVSGWSGYISLGIFLVIGVIIFLLIANAMFTVSQQTPEIIERFGKFHRIVEPGLRFKIPMVDQRAKRINLRVHQLLLQVDTKTLDDVFVEIKVAIQYAVLPEKIFDAAYKLQDVNGQITSYVFDIVRGQVPKMKLDDVFAQKDEISNGVKTELSEKMSDYGYMIHHAPVTDIVPDARVRDAMNEINANTRLRIAATEKGEASRILQVKAATATKESDILSGEGIAGKRKAIIDGLRAAVEEFKASVPESATVDVMKVVLLTQYFDMLKSMANEHGSRVIFTSHSPGSVAMLGQQIQEALAADKA